MSNMRGMRDTDMNTIQLVKQTAATQTFAHIVVCKKEEGTHIYPFTALPKYVVTIHLALATYVFMILYSFGSCNFSQSTNMQSASVLIYV